MVLEDLKDHRISVIALAHIPLLIYTSTLGIIRDGDASTIFYNNYQGLENNQGFYQEAVSGLRKATRIYSAFTPAHAKLSRAYPEIGSCDEAFAEFKNPSTLERKK